MSFRAAIVIAMAIVIMHDGWLRGETRGALQAAGVQPTRVWLWPDNCVYVCMYVYVYLSLYIYIHTLYLSLYIYIYREREIDTFEHFTRFTQLKELNF